MECNRIKWNGWNTESGCKPFLIMNSFMELDMQMKREPLKKSNEGGNIKISFEFMNKIITEIEKKP